MADYAFGGNEDETAELKKLNGEVVEDPDNYEMWEKLVRAAESVDGGINRNSSPQAITAMRDVYDRFLAKFPLFFGYWKKYADLEFSIAGTEAAEMVYERGVASISNSVDLWSNYCSFKTDTSHDSDVIRDGTSFDQSIKVAGWARRWALLFASSASTELATALRTFFIVNRWTSIAHHHTLFERGANSVGLDFLAHPFWDKYLEFEERMDGREQIFTILGRIIHIPMHQYARYFEKYRQLAQSRQFSDLVPPNVLTQFRMELENEGLGYNAGRADQEVERDLRARIDNFHLEVFHRTQAETTKRWTYESEIKRPYFHVTDIDEAQLTNWRKYLDYEEGEGDYVRTQFLYERCLVACAHYAEFWLRYARWMLGQPGKEEEVRNIYQRASCFYVPIALPQMRLQYAFFEEMSGRVEVAKDIHDAILVAMPGHVETIVSLANMSRRQGGLDAAIQVYKVHIDSQTCGISAKAALVAEWARLLWKIKGSASDARQVFQKNQHWYLESMPFWSNYLDFELQQPTSAEAEHTHYEQIKKVAEDIQLKSKLSPAGMQELLSKYMVYLLERGTGDAAKEYMTLDREIHGPPSVQSIAVARTIDPGKDAPMSNGQTPSIR